VAAFPSWNTQHHGYAEIKNGKVVETPEVQHATAAHFAAIAKAGGYAYGHASDDSYAHDYSHNDHADIKYDGKYGYHYPIIKNGVPVEPIEVQHARAEHYAAVAKAPIDPHYHEPEHHDDDDHHDDYYHYAPAYNGAPKKTAAVQHAEAAHFAAVAEAKARLHHHYKRSADYYHVPVIHNGVPVDTPEVQHAKAAHYAAHAAAQSHGHYDVGHYDAGHQEESHGGHYKHVAEHHDQKYDGKYGYHYPIIKNGVPVDTEEVQYAKAKHYAAVHEAQAHASYDDGHHDDGHYDEKKHW
jgi:hypothetical protein